jgi:hypothetical protein
MKIQYRRTKHEQVMPYEAFWEGPCSEHKR